MSANGVGPDGTVVRTWSELKDPHSVVTEAHDGDKRSRTDFLRDALKPLNPETWDPFMGLRLG